MNTDERWSHLVALDEEFLKGSVLLSEWCSFIVREVDIAFVHGANLAAILTAVSGIETYLRSEYAVKGRAHLNDLIERSSISNSLKADLHTLRKYRNRWVHVNDPWRDSSLLERPGEMDQELEDMAFLAARVLRSTIYENQSV